MSPIAISPSLRRHSHYDVIHASRAYGARSPRSHYHVVLIMTSFATELTTPSVTDVRYVRTPYRVLYIKILKSQNITSHTESLTKQSST